MFVTAVLQQYLVQQYTRYKNTPLTRLAHSSGGMYTDPSINPRSQNNIDGCPHVRAKRSKPSSSVICRLLPNPPKKTNEQDNHVHVCMTEACASKRVHG